MLLFSLTFGNAACQAHTINYSPRVRISCSQCSHSYVIVNTQSQASRIKQVKHGIAASPAAPRNDRKRNQPFIPPSRCHCERVKRARQSPPQKPLQKSASQKSYCASTAVVITSVAIFAKATTTCPLYPHLHRVVIASE